MRKFQGIKAILFDIDDTLFPSSAFASLARKNAIAAMFASGMQASSISAKKELEKIISKYGSNYSGHFNRLVEKFKCKDKNYSVAAGIWAYHSTKACISPYPKVKNALLKLQKRGFILCVASEGIEIKQWDKLIRLGLDSNFNHVFVTPKKDEKFYLSICKKLKLSPNQILMVGDNPSKDILEARKAGLKTLRILLGKHSKLKDTAHASSTSCVQIGKYL